MVAAAAAAAATTTDSETAVAPARKKRQTGLAATAAATPAGGLARKAPARLELPFKLDRAKMAARTALRVLSSFLGTDLVLGALTRSQLSRTLRGGCRRLAPPRARTSCAQRSSLER